MYKVCQIIFVSLKMYVKHKTFENYSIINVNQVFSNFLVDTVPLLTKFIFHSPASQIN